MQIIDPNKTNITFGQKVNMLVNGLWVNCFYDSIAFGGNEDKIMIPYGFFGTKKPPTEKDNSTMFGTVILPMSIPIRQISYEFIYPNYTYHSVGGYFETYVRKFSEEWKCYYLRPVKLLGLEKEEVLKKFLKEVYKATEFSKPTFIFGAHNEENLDVVHEIQLPQSEFINYIIP